MKAIFTQLLVTLVLLTAGTFGGDAVAQTGVLNPNDPIVLYNKASPPAYPAQNTLVKWVKTTRMSYNTDDFKAYFYNNIQFRLKWPKTFATDPPGTKYPLYMFFHGVGEGGTIYDNEFQMSHGGNVHQAAANNGAYDGFLLYPQSSAASGGWSQTQVDVLYNLILNYLIPQEQVDPDRIIVSGLSGGGDATWMFMESHPTMPAAGFVMSSANISDIQYAGTLKYTNIWLFQGGLDKSPDPSTTIQLVNAYNNAGGNLTYTVFPNNGHNTWDNAWQEPGYFPWMSKVNKSKPWTLTGKNKFCPGTTVSGTMGVVAGMSSYQWRLNGTPISGATSNSYNFSSLGNYDVTFVNNGYTSPYFGIDTISTQAPTISPNIQLNGLESDVVPAPDGSTSVSLTVPSGYASYTWERVDSPAGKGTILTNTTNVLNGATPGQYAVEVTVQFGCSSSFSAPFTVVRANGPTPPAAPTNLLATTMSKTQIKLTWNESGGQPNPETQFEVYQGSSATGAVKLIGFSPAGVDSFMVSGLNPNTTYYYRVRAINATGGSATAGPSGAQTQADITPPTAAGNLRTGVIGQTSIQLVWDPATDDVGVVAYDIYVNGNKVYTSGNVNNFTVYNLMLGQSYTFAIKAKDFAGNIGPFSNQLVATPQFNGLVYSYYSGSWTTLPDFNSLVPLATGTVANITLSNALATTNYGFLWQGYINVPVAGSYTFETISRDGSKVYIDVPYTSGATAVVSNDGVHSSRTVAGTAVTLSAGVHMFAATYFHAATSVGSLQVLWKTPQSAGKFVAIPNSAFVQVITPAGTAPAAPSGLAAVAVSAKKITISWQDNSNNETGFQLFRATSAAGPFLAVATAKPNQTSYGDSSLTASTQYFYIIRAINQYGSSATTGQDSANTTTQALPALPAAPGSLTGSGQGPTHAALSWANNASNATGIEVWRSPVTNTNYVLVTTLPVLASFLDSGLVNNTLYFYKVRAINEGGPSAYSNEISLTTSNAAVTIVTLSPVANQNMVNDTTQVIPVTAASSSPGAAITFSATGLPAFASLTDNHNGTASITLHPNSTQLGTFSGAILTATDALGGSSSDTFSVTVSGRNATTVQVTFNTSNYPVSLAGWNAMNVAGAVAGVSVGNFNDVNGNATTEGINLVSSWDGAYNTGMNTGNNSGIYPDAVLKNFYFGSTFNPYTFKVTGLSSSKKYALVFFAGYPWAASDVATYGNLITSYAVGGQAVTLNVANNINQTVQLSGLSPDATGAITVTVTKPLGSAYCLINDLQIMAYDAPPSVAALIPPSKLVANGLTANSIQLGWVGSPDTRTGFEIWRSNNPGGSFSLLAAVSGSASSYTDAGLPSNSTWFYEVREVVNGNQYSGFSNIAGGSTVQYTVNLSLNSQTTGAADAPWNDLNTFIANGFSLQNMKDMNFHPTGINFNVINTFTSFNDQLGVSTGNNSGVVPDAVMKTFYYNAQGDTATVSVSGLPKNGIFNFGFYAGTDYSNSPTVSIFQIGNQAVSINAFMNTTNMVFINGVKPDSTGTVVITFYTDASTPYGMWNSLTIQGMPSPDVVAADSAGTSGTIAAAIHSNGVAGTATAMDAIGATAADSLDNRPQAGAMNVYPNPFTDNVTVQFELAQPVGKFTLVVADVSGRIAEKVEFSNAPAGVWSQVVNLSRLPKGMYFIHVFGLAAADKQSFRIVKVR